MTLVKLISLECSYIQELLYYSKHNGLNIGGKSALYLDSIMNTIITNILRELYYEPIELTINDIIDVYNDLEIDNGIDLMTLQSILDVVNRIKIDIIGLVIMECSVVNTTTHVDVIAGRFLNIYIYDISPLPGAYTEKA